MRIILCVASLVLLWGSVAEAHSVYVFGRIAEGRLCAHGYFAKDRPVIDGGLEVRAAGRPILTGRTDQNGRWCADVPPGEGDLELILNAGQGHRAEFTVSRPAAGAEATASPAVVAPPVSPASSAGADVSASGGSANLFAGEPQGPGLKDLLGGLGWIVALCALGYIFLQRHSSSLK